jgi:NADH:ubiquinone oxidoreductase subunit 6 (subunit J)
MEAKKIILPSALLFALATNVAALDFLERLRHLDQDLLCTIIIFVPGVLVLFLLIAGLIYIMGDEGHRATAKGMIRNAILGILLVVVFIMMSLALTMGTISLDNCWG